MHSSSHSKNKSTSSKSNTLESKATKQTDSDEIYLSPTIALNQPQQNVNITWIGPPCTRENGYPVLGLDRIGLELFTQSNPQNIPFVFWCLRKYQSYYTQQLAEAPNEGRFQIKYVEDILEHRWEDSETQRLVTSVKKIIDTCLYGKNHGSVRDRTFVKDIFNLLLVVLEGGYAIDTSLLPDNDKPFIFPCFNEFCVPICIDEDAFFRKKPEGDLWLFYSPKKNHPSGVSFLNHVIESWSDAVKYHPASSQYYLTLGGILLGPLNGMLANRKMAGLLRKSDLMTKLPELNVVKIYSNMHHHSTTKKDFYKLEPLLRAAFYGHEGWLEALIRHGNDLLVRTPRELWHELCCFYHNESALSIALRYYHPRCVQILFLAGADLNEPIVYSFLHNEKPPIHTTVKELIKIGIRFKTKPNMVLPDLNTNIFRDIAEHADLYQEILEQEVISQNVKQFYQTSQSSIVKKLEQQIEKSFEKHSIKQLQRIETALQVSQHHHQSQPRSAWHPTLIGATCAALFAPTAACLGYSTIAKFTLFTGPSLGFGLDIIHTAEEKNKTKAIVKLDQLVKTKLSELAQPNLTEETTWTASQTLRRRKPS